MNSKPFSRFGKIYLFEPHPKYGAVIVQKMAQTEDFVLVKALYREGTVLTPTTVKMPHSEWATIFKSHHYIIDETEANDLHYCWLLAREDHSASNPVPFSDLKILDGFYTLGGLGCVKLSGRSYIEVGTETRLVSVKDMQVYKANLFMELSKHPKARPYHA